MSTSNNRVDSGQGIMETRQLILPVHLSGNRSSKQSLASRLISGNRVNYILIATLSCYRGTIRRLAAPTSIYNSSRWLSFFQFIFLASEYEYYIRLFKRSSSRNEDIFRYHSTSFTNVVYGACLIVNFHEMDAFYVVFDDIETLLQLFSFF